MKKLMTIVVSALCATVSFTSVAEMTRQKNAGALINAKIEAESVGGEVVLDDDTIYELDDNTITIDKKIVLRSQSGDPKRCILLGNCADRVLTITKDAADTRVSGLTVTGGNVTGASDSSSGGGISAAAKVFLSGLIVSNNTSAVNTAGGGGAGIYIAGADSVVSNCLVCCNNGDTSNGIGILFNAAGLLVDCTVTNNVSSVDGGTSRKGGGVTLQKGKCSVVRCFIAGNKQRYGGGVQITQLTDASLGDILIEDSVIAQNEGSRYYAGGIDVEACASLTVRRCVFIGNTTGTTVNYGEQSGGAIALRGNFPTIVDSCVVVSNTATAKGSRGAGFGGAAIYVSALPTTGLEIRNSFFAYNKGRSIIGLQPGTSASESEESNGVRLYSCTLVSNALIAADEPVVNGDANLPLRFWSKNNLIADNFYNTTEQNGFDAALSERGEQVARVAYTIAPGAGTAVELHNNPARARANGVLQDWMKGQSALGDGSYQIVKTADYGVRPDFGPRVRRAGTPAPSIGCYEYASGLMLIIW